MGSCDLTSGIVGVGTLLCILTVCLSPITVADMDIINVCMGLECEDEPDQIGSRQQDGNGVHQRPRKTFLN